MEALPSDTFSIWNRIIDILRDKVGEIRVKTWIESIDSVSFDKSACTLTTPSPFHQCILETKFYNMIEEAVNSVTGGNYTLTVAAKPNDIRPIMDKSIVNWQINDRLIPSYTFENFVSGSCNKNALYAAHNVLSAVYSPPLFIYGGTGTGKTYLLHAIGNDCKKNKAAKILYTVVSDFINDLITGIKDDNLHAMERNLEHLDLFLIDDLHLIEVKPFAQSQLINMLTRLKNKDVKLVLASTKPIGAVIDKYCTNLIRPCSEVKMYKPDFYTKKKILKRYAEAYGVSLSDEAVESIAKVKYQGVRELKGAFNKARLQNMLISNG